jgi:DNA-binding CsgD family transcriptional regulator
MTAQLSGGGRGIFGRDIELLGLNSFLDELNTGPSVLVLEGEPGIGKSCLWEAGVTEARERGFTILSSRPTDPEAGLSFVGLGDLMEHVGPDVLSSLPGAQRHALDIALLRTDAAEAILDWRAVHVAVLGVLRALAGSAPTLIAIDDSRWLDLSSSRALAFAVRRLRDGPVGLLVTVGNAIRDRAPLGSEALPDERRHLLKLQPLSLEALGLLVRARLGRDLAPPTLQRLQELSGGNPFYAMEIVRASERGDPRPTGQALPIPTTLREDVVRHRLAALSARTRRVLLAAASTSRPSLEVIGATTDGTDVRAAVEEAIGAGVLVQTDGQIDFTHPILRSAVYSEASRSERHDVHRRLADVARDPEERARHLALGSDGPEDAIADALEEAADAAWTRGALVTAADLLELALIRTPAENSEAIHRRRIRAAEHHHTVGDSAPALHHLELAVEAAPTPAHGAEALTLLARILLDTDQAAASRYLNEVSRLLRGWEPHDPRNLPFVPDAVETLISMDHLPEAETLLDWLEERSRTRGMVSMEAIAARCRGMLSAARSDLADARHSLEEALGYYDRSPIPFERGRTLLVLGSVLRREKRKRAAREVLEEAVAIFDRLGAIPWAEKAHRELARISGRRTSGAELTSSQRDVARLAAAGRTNREIAETLFMSVRTVEGHLSHVYAKLGIRSRTELALFVDETDGAGIEI